MTAEESRHRMGDLLCFHGDEGSMVIVVTSGVCSCMCRGRHTEPHHHTYQAAQGSGSDAGMYDGHASFELTSFIDDTAVTLSRNDADD